MTINQSHTGWRTLFLVLVIFFSCSTYVLADVIIDNDDPGTISDGTWRTSGGSNPYGSSSIYARPTATYTWQFDSQPAGQYEVLMWWTTVGSRGSNITVDINAETDHTRQINQQENAGQWNSLGTFLFNTSGSVTITASDEILSDGRIASTCADAVWFRQVSVSYPPTAFIDSINPNPADSGEEVVFMGHGEDDGSITDFAWFADQVIPLGNSPTVSTDSLSDGVHEISLRVQDNEGLWSSPATATLQVGYIPSVVIIDNGDTGTSSSGNWRSSSADNWYGTESLYSRDGDTYTWTFSPAVTSDYELSIWWTEHPNRDSQVPIEIEHQDGTETIIVDQRQNGGQWNVIDQYYFMAGSDYRITVTAQPGSTSTCADAVRFVSINTNLPPVATIESVLPNPADSGADISFSGSGYDPDGTIGAYLWNSNIDLAWEGTSDSFSSNELSDGIHEISFMVSDNQGRWSEPVVEMLIVGTPPPVATIESITPNPAAPGDLITFTGSGYAPLGTIDGYLWELENGDDLSTDAVFSTSSLSTGTHTISLTVFSDGVASLPVTQDVEIILPDIIIDNGDTGTSSTGEWKVSSGSDPYGTDSLFARPDATYTWQFDSHPVGLYEVYLWWTETTTRGTNIEVDINGSETRTINQLENGGQWNSIGQFYFDSSGSVTVIATGSTSTCADAARFRFITSNHPPEASIDEVTPSPAEPGEMISFRGSGVDPDPDGEITGYYWESNLDGMLNEDSDEFEAMLSEGIHEITFRVKDNEDTWSEPVTTTVVCGEILEEFEIDNGGAGTSSTGEWRVSSGANPFGENSIYARNGATYTWEFTPLASADYALYMWWTEYPSRDNNIPVTIENEGGEDTVYIDQTDNGGQWNFLGQYSFIVGNTYRVTITAPGSTSTCADAIRFVQVDNEVPPAANFSADQTIGTQLPFSVNFFDQSIGQVDAWLWDFGDGTTSSDPNPTHTYTTPDRYSVSLTVSNAFGSDTIVRDAYIRFSGLRENIYIGNSYSVIKDYVMGQVADAVGGLGGYTIGDSWVYTNEFKGVTYYVKEVTTLAEWEAALKEEGSHVIFNGHSNYGLGSVWVGFTRLNEIQFFDDDLIFNCSTDMVNPSITGIKYSQAYPNWEPVYKDGTSAVMPFDFGDPRGLPPYNYHLTYTLPGDPTHYRIEEMDGDYIERFPDSRKPAWYSPDGLPPDPDANTEYFITNPNPHYPHTEFIGDWEVRTFGDWHYAEYYEGYRFQSHEPGVGNNKAIFYVVVETAGMYEVLATWQPNTANATNAKYTIQHADTGDGEYSTVVVDQTVSAIPNSLGIYYFEPGQYTIELSDDANGVVVADSVSLFYADDPRSVTTAQFSTTVKQGTAPLAVQFADYITVFQRGDNDLEITYLWDFGDGTTSEEEDPLHVYEAPGIYTVSLTITDEHGNTGTEVKENLIVVDDIAPLNAEFRARRLVKIGSGSVWFRDQSSGNITDWELDFGDGTSSTSRRSWTRHTYTEPGSYTVSLTVSGPDGSDTDTETNLVHVTVGSTLTDNEYTEKMHYFRKYSGTLIGSTIMDASAATIPSEELKYSRFFYNACYTGRYFLGKFNRGIVYYTTGGREQDISPIDDYLRLYLLGESDDVILETMNESHYIHGYFDFNKLPPSMR